MELLALHGLDQLADLLQTEVLLRTVSSLSMGG